MTCYFGGLLLVMTLALPRISYSQYDSPVNYMSYLSAIEVDMAKDYMSYMSAMAHGSSPRRMERRRQEVLSTIQEGRQKVARLKPYQKETTLRDAYAKYFSILQSILKEDYSKIVNMEEIAEQSYDAMEAYLLAQEKASEKLEVAADTLQQEFRKFAAKNNVRLIESESKVSRKLKQTGRVTNYYNQIYLIYFKSSKQEGYIVAASNSGNVNSVEQNKSTLIKYVIEGLGKLDGIKPLDNDFSLVTACRNLLEFQKTEGEIKIPSVTDYLVRREEFLKFKKMYDAKPAQQRTSTEVDDYNAMVDEMNASAATFNKTNEEMNTQRTKLSDNWSSAVKKFLDAHIPK
jgi:hypothetical protein